jgi:hypothetical protein
MDRTIFPRGLPGGSCLALAAFCCLAGCQGAPEVSAATADCRYESFDGLCAVTGWRQRPAPGDDNHELTVTFVVKHLPHASFDQTFVVSQASTSSFISSLRDTRALPCKGRVLASGPPACSVKTTGVVEAFEGLRPPEPRRSPPAGGNQAP